MINLIQTVLLGTFAAAIAAWGLAEAGTLVRWLLRPSPLSEAQKVARLAARAEDRR